MCVLGGYSWSKCKRVTDRYSFGYPANHPVLQGLCKDWLAQCQVVAEIACLICNVCLGVAACQIACGDLSL